MNRNDYNGDAYQDNNIDDNRILESELRTNQQGSEVNPETNDEGWNMVRNRRSRTPNPNTTTLMLLGLEIIMVQVILEEILPL